MVPQKRKALLHLNILVGLCSIRWNFFYSQTERCSAWYMCRSNQQHIYYPLSLVEIPLTRPHGLSHAEQEQLFADYANICLHSRLRRLAARRATNLVMSFYYSPPSINGI